MNSNRPAHDQIARRAQKIWLDYGCPHGRDDEVWLEAERQLGAGAAKTSPDSAHAVPPTARGSESPAALADRFRAETAAESVVEYLISPAIPEAEAVKAALQNKPPAG
jgi:hypothetical protein